MPVYNGERYLKEAIDSILNQTYIDFEFIIINDGSTDKTEGVILSYHDSRIRYIKNEKNLQIVNTLNKGIELARGKYIARMDADDISLPERLEKQVAYLDKNLDIGIVGTLVQIFGQDIKDTIWKVPVDCVSVSLNTIFRTPFIHPTIMMRKDMISQYELYYDEKYKNAEDYELWVRMLKFTKGANLPIVLFKYRILESSLTRQAEKNKQERFKIKMSIFRKVLNDFNIKNTDEEMQLHYKITSSSMAMTKMEISQVIKYFNKLDLAIKQNQHNDSIVLQDLLGQVWIKILKELNFKVYFNLFSKYTFYGIRFYFKRFSNFRRGI